MRKKPFFNGNPLPNTFIGGVGASSVTSTTALASKLSILSHQIKNFKIDNNNNVSCYINRNYSINSTAWSTDSIITYYIDIGGNCTYLNTFAFQNAFNPATRKTLVFPNVTGCDDRIVSGGGAGTRNKLGIICLPQLEPIGGSGTTNDNNFSWADFFYNVYVHSGNTINNAGGVDADISSPISSNIGTYIKYSDNLDKPSGATGLYTVSATTSSIELAWNSVTHTNIIDYYVVFGDGVIKGTPNSSTSLNVTGLSSGTTYEFKILVIDEMGNNSNFSNVYSGSTL